MNNYDFVFFIVNNSYNNNKINKLIYSLKKTYNIELIIPNKNNGFAYGNNTVLNKLVSKYHFVINPDIKISSKIEIKKMILYMNSNLNVSLLSPLIKYPNGEIQHLIKNYPTLLDLTLRFLRLPILKKRQEKFINLPDGYSNNHSVVNVPGSFMMFRTETFKKINGFDENYFLYMEDSDITMKINQVSKSMFFSEAYVYHEWQRNNIKNFKSIMQMLKSIIIYFNKWGWKIF